MGKKSGPKLPPPPDPKIAIAAQAAANKEALRESARVNAINTYTPTGSVTYTKDANGLPTAQHVNVSGTAQDTLNRQEGIANNLAGISQYRTMGIPTDHFSTSGTPYGQDRATSLIDSYGSMGDQRGELPYDPRSYGDFDSYRNDVQDAFMAQQKRNLEPVFEQQYERQQQDLANRGLPVGGEAYNKATSNLNRDQSNAWQNASNQAVLMAGQEADRRIASEQGLRQASFGEAQKTHQQGLSDTSNKLQAEQNYRNQNIQENILGRTQNMNEIAMLLGGSPNMQVPQANGQTSYQLQAPDVIGATFQAHNAATQNAMAQHQGKQSGWQGAANIATGLGSLAFKSSRSFKHEDGPPPERMLDKIEPLQVRTWKYTHNIDPRQEVHIGPYAEDWKRYLGLGNGKEIAVQDAFGVALKCIQELHEEMSDLRDEFAKVKKQRRSKR